MLLVLNQSESITEMDRELISLTKDMQRIVLLNKNDLPNKLDKDELQNILGKHHSYRYQF